jgi:hypothetical protein
MARGAVKAKQAQKRGAQPAKAAPRRAARGRKRHAGGGNPNQQLFFMRLRRQAKPMYVILAVLFALTFAFLGVGSGSGGGLDQLFQGLNPFSGGGTSVSKAQKEVKAHPSNPKGFRDLATAYEAKNDRAGAISALQSYTTLKPKDVSALGSTRTRTRSARLRRRASSSSRPGSSARRSARTSSSRPRLSGPTQR